MHRRILPVLLVVVATAIAADAGAATCDAAIRRVERRYGLPEGLLLAVGRTEAALSTGTADPIVWSLTINAEGMPMRFGSARLAAQAVRRLQEEGVRSIDTGCLQVNLKHHPQAFERVEDAFDPDINADYGGRYLLRLYRESGAWDAAVGRYHAGRARPEAARRYACAVYRNLARLRAQRPNPCR